MSEAVAEAAALLRASCGDRLRVDFPLAPLTTLRVGGPAALYLAARSAEDLVAVAEAIRRTGIVTVVLGKGSNVLVSDAGVDGLVLRLDKAFRWARVDGGLVEAGASMPLPALAGVALAHALTGIEWGVAIPATFGGAVRMNAGAHSGDVAAVAESVDVFDLARAERVVIPAAQAGFRYRGSTLPSTGVVVAAALRLHEGDPVRIRARMDEVREWRREHQPLAEPNCGSVFKNPEGDFAARLIEAAGLKGHRVGGASVSSVHSNFIVTSPGARSADVVGVIRAVQRAVRDRYGIELEPEVHLVGDFDVAPR